MAELVTTRFTPGHRLIDGSDLNDAFDQVNSQFLFGSGAPTLSAAKGTLYIRTDGSSTSTRMYINTDGATTWTNFTTAA